MAEALEPQERDSLVQVASAINCLRCGLVRLNGFGKDANAPTITTGDDLESPNASRERDVALTKAAEISGQMCRARAFGHAAADSQDERDGYAGA